eukprot:CAMPEP_0171306406 /NCGR_PEP_ID=MMETSP0816-20121228/16413_1 /TAXON_ID=420281 /ORGANISM="Proboscia inermis, Strain CCAP1064/1" /LENGTH=74 /DNA_ID=CAMNT_0011787965 /DNA_START=65 /DNA_END=286 /DNA_ORIENTATION=-
MVPYCSVSFFTLNPSAPRVVSVHKTGDSELDWFPIAAEIVGSTFAASCPLIPGLKPRIFRKNAPKRLSGPLRES